MHALKYFLEIAAAWKIMQSFREIKRVMIDVNEDDHLLVAMVKDAEYGTYANSEY